MPLIISMRPKFARLIFSGEKKFELRRKFARVPSGTRAIIYASENVRAFVGEFKVGRIFRLRIDDLWEFVGPYAKVSFKEFLRYFKRCTKGVAIEIRDPFEYPKAIPLDAVRLEIRDNMWAPPVDYEVLPDNHPIIVAIDNYLSVIMQDKSSEGRNNRRLVARPHRQLVGERGGGRGKRRDPARTR
ncbi:MAG: hypothetical protein ACTSXJ_03365 [Candidatus Baldrarchaeia archaeon]